jgi:hypothetical protein
VSAARPPALTLEASGRRFGRYVWAERRLFELLGGWSGDTADPAARPVLAGHAAHHGWRAEVLATRLPRARGLDVEGWIAPPGDRLVECFDALAGPGPTETTARLVGVYRVVAPRLGQAYLDHLDRLVEISDRPTIRWLRLVLRDELADWRAGLELLEGRDEHAVEGHRRRVEGLMTAAGGITGEQSGEVPAIQVPSGDEHNRTATLPSTWNLV